ncbi:hypothetical protein HK100_008159 [Physocladia obscura]|uniref:Uncharacterized protein n=1 Tax=Physocladia obscura TaxID=109957 RepID=A0AAD5XBN9_9FUNG|nr:hypothetical protein HK100_008159 [Physocladia obscura]
MQVIRLLDSEGLRVLDSLSAEYEDSFCLESFGDLIAAHEGADPQGTKSFIIARVQTWDHKQPDSKFFSYYNAYHLNKILFQTQIYLDKKLIHRLHVLNPLSNTDIIGHVQYFMVRKAANSVKISNASIETHQNPAEIIIQITEASNDPDSGQNSISSSGTSSKKPAISINTSKSLGIPAPTSLELPPPSPSVRDIESGNPTSWTRISPTITAISEEDEPTTHDEKSDTNQLTAATQLKSPTPPSISFFRRISRITGIRSAITSHPPPIDLESPRALFSPQPHKQHQKSIRVDIPDGTPTAHARPVSAQTVPPTHRARRRSLSFRNATSAVHASFEEWLNMVSAEADAYRVGDDGETAEKSAGELFDTVPAFGSSGDKRGGNGDVILEENNRDGEKRTEDGGMFLTTIDAVLFATDDDFLESAKIRAVFRANAIVPDEAKLFEMTPVTSELSSGSPSSSEAQRRHRRRRRRDGDVETEEAEDENDEDSMACDWCFPREDELKKHHGIIRLFYRYKCYLLLIAFFAVLIVL